MSTPHTQPNTTSDSSAKDGAHLQITLLGHMSILVDGQPLPKMPGYIVQALLAYLFCHPGPHERIKLADLLWGDMPRDRLLSNLRSLVHRLPAAVKPYIQTTPQTVGIEPSDDIWVDVLALSALATPSAILSCTAKMFRCSLSKVSDQR